jgi:uncharacterized integral membrane protein (TIGR00697 family)
MKRNFSVPFVLMTLMFCVFLILANVMEVKVVRVGAFTATAGLAVFPISYIINDCITEVYGFQRARLVIWLGFLMNLFFVLFLQVAISLPADPAWHDQSAVVAVFSRAPRILLGSFVAFIFGSMVNAYVMSKMKILNRGRYFSLRAVVSTLFGETVDSLIFFPIAFGGVLPWRTIGVMILTQAVLKTVYEVIVLPVTVRVVRYVKRLERLDVYDAGIDYRWWRIDKF